jgi:glycosyltransferase involved in cell wall biosynthesis
VLAAAGRWDAIHYADPGSFGAAAGILNGAVAGRSMPPPRVLITYSGLKDGVSRRVPAALRRHARSGGAVHVVSEGLWSALVREGFDEDLLTVIHPGAEIPAPADPGDRAATRKELGLDPDHEVIGVAAVLDGDRGMGELIEAAGILFGERPRARLVIVGDGPRRGALEEKARRADGGGRIIFTGWREETARIIRALDVYVFPGRGQEVFPLSLVEAMASGTPVVACDQAGIREIIENGKQGLIVPGTGAGALARTMGRALDEPERSRRMGQAGAVRVQRFNVRAMVEATERLYYRLTRSGGAT